MHYIAIIHKDPDSAFGVSFPDIPDCFAAADTYGEIMQNSIAALDDYFADGHEYPEPKGLEQIQTDFAEDLAHGAILMMIPVITADTKTERINVTIERGLLKAIDEAQNMSGIPTRSAWLAMAAKRFIQDDIQRH